MRGLNVLFKCITTIERDGEIMAKVFNAFNYDDYTKRKEYFRGYIDSVRVSL